MELHAGQSTQVALLRIVALHAAFRLIEQHGSGSAALPPGLDLHRELQAITPDSIRHVLDDLFGAGTIEK